MISSLRGTVVDKSPDSVVIECAGVGYLVYCTPQTVASLVRDEETKLITHLVVREDAMVLYGFTDAGQRDLFLLLQTVSKVGPKAALSFLGAMPLAELVHAISSGDSKRLTTVQGVGKQTANRVIVDLKDKIGSIAGVDELGAPHPQADADVNQDILDEVSEALRGLGFTDREIVPVVRTFLAENPTAPVSEVLRNTLTMLGKKRGA